MGATTAEKLRGGARFDPNTRALAPRTWSKAGLGVGCRRGSPPPAVRVWAYHPRNFFSKTQMLNLAFW